MISPLQPQSLAAARNKAAASKFGSGYATAPFLLNNIDFHHIGETTRPQVMGIYTTIIASRLWKARSFNELRENFVRDSLGWYNWFMAGPLMQTALVLFVVPKVFPPAKNFLLGKPATTQNWWQKTRCALLEPMKRWPITGYGQLQQRKEQLIKLFNDGKLSGKVSEAELKMLKKAFDRSMQLRSMLTAFGLGFALICLGIVLPRINIAMTRSNVRRQQDARYNNRPGVGGAVPPNPNERKAYGQGLDLLRTKA